jgi:hypothetical protein
MFGLEDQSVASMYAGILYGLREKYKLREILNTPVMTFMEKARLCGLGLINQEEYIEAHDAAVEFVNQKSDVLTSQKPVEGYKSSLEYDLFEGIQLNQQNRSGKHLNFSEIIIHESIVV